MGMGMGMGMGLGLPKQLPTAKKPRNNTSTWMVTYHDLLLDVYARNYGVLRELSSSCRIKSNEDVFNVIRS